MFQRNRILMSEADTAGGGNGAAPVVTPETPAPPAAPTPVVPAPIDANAIATQVRDSLFAELRRAGVLGKQPKPKDGDPPPTPVATPPQFDPFAMRKLDFALNKIGIAADLNQSQYERAHRDFATESPVDAESWAKDYFHGFRSAAPQPIAAAAAAPAPKTPQNPQPASDRGSPPPSAVPLAEADLWTMSDSDRAALIREKGIKWYTDRLKAQGKGRTVSLR